MKSQSWWPYSTIEYRINAVLIEYCVWFRINRENSISRIEIFWVWYPLFESRRIIDLSYQSILRSTMCNTAREIICINFDLSVVYWRSFHYTISFHVREFTLARIYRKIPNINPELIIDISPELIDISKHILGGLHSGGLYSGGLYSEGILC